MDLPIDEVEFCKNIVTAIGVEPVLEFSDDASQVAQQRRDRDGRLLWSISVAYQGEGARRPEVLQIRVASEVEPVVVPGPIRFGGLLVRTWEMGDRRGVSFSAQTFTQAEPPSVRRAKEAAAV